MKKKNVKAGQIEEASVVLKDLLNADLPLKQSYKFYQLSLKLEPIYKLILDKKKPIIEKYGKKQKDGTFNIPNDNRENFFKEISKIYEEEIEVEFDPININELMDHSDVIKISAAKLMSISWLFNEVIEEE